MKENSEKNWATATLKQAPFWRDNMQPEEYDIEREYFYNHYEDYKNGKYVPLWRQAVSK